MFRKRFIKLPTILLAMIITVLTLPTAAFAAEGDSKLTILHINDRHGRTGADAYISRMAKDMKTAGENVLVLDAGDSLHGQTMTNLTKGSGMATVMNYAGYDAMVAGNHDFNFGVDRMTELAAQMNFPLLGANVIKADGTNLLDSYKIFEMNDLKVGVFGICTPETVTNTDPRIIAGLTFRDPATTAAEIVAELTSENCDVIVALTHLGLDEATLPANRSTALAAVDGIDVIIDGHSHTLLENGRTVNDVMIGQTGEFAENIGIIEITVSDNKVNKIARLVPMTGEAALPADEAIVAAIAAEEVKIEPITSVVIGNSPVLLEGSRNMVRTVETNLADVITDSMIWATGADFAFLTGGNIRASIEAGEITMGDVLTTLPFSNLLVTVELSGTDVIKVLEHGIDQHPEEAATRIHVSGLHFTFDPAAAPGSRIVNVTTKDGSVLDPTGTYVLSTSEFLAVGGDGYDMLANGKNLIYYSGDADALAGYIATKPAFQAEPEGRVTVIESEAAVPSSAPETGLPDISMIEPMPMPTVVPLIHIVQPGEYLKKIADMYNTTWEVLQKLNNIAFANLIYPGQELKLPAA